MNESLRRAATDCVTIEQPADDQLGGGHGAEERPGSRAPWRVGAACAAARCRDRPARNDDLHTRPPGPGCAAPERRPGRAVPALAGTPRADAARDRAGANLWTRRHG